MAALAAKLWHLRHRLPGTAVTLLLTAGSKKNAKTIEEHEARIMAIESDMKHMPNAEAVHKLQLDISETKGTIGILAKAMEGTERTARRVEEFLLNRGNAA